MELCDFGSLTDAVMSGKFHDPPPRPRGSSSSDGGVTGHGGARGPSTVHVDVQCMMEASRPEGR